MNFIDSAKWAIQIHENGTWECEHVDVHGMPQPSTILDLQNAHDPWPEAEPERRRYRIACPDCGTWWRIWAHARKACYYAAPRWGEPPVVARQPQYLQPVRRHIHTIIDAVKQALPLCIITQEAAYLPTTNDDGIWDFSLPMVKKSVQIESGDGMCPFLVETDDWSSHDARVFQSAEETAAIIIAYLSAQLER